MDDVTVLIKLAFIQKIKGKWCVLGESKTDKGKHRNFGCYKSKTEAKKRLSQIHFFKGRGALDGMIEVADILDRKGMIHLADAIMDCLGSLVAASLGAESDKHLASVKLGKVASLLDRKGETELADRLDAIMPTMVDAESGISDCPDCPNMEVTVTRCCSVTKSTTADKLYAMAAKFRQMYREGLVDEGSFEYRKFRELRYMLRTGFMFPPPLGQDLPKDADSWWNHFEGVDHE